MTQVQIERKKEYDRKFSREYRLKHPEWKKADNKKNLPMVGKLVKEYYKKYPERGKAHKAVQTALLNGKLVKGICISCSEEKTEGHHENYDKPLDVMWMCHSCHKKYHFGLLKL